MTHATNRDRLIVLISVTVFLSIFILLWMRKNFAAEEPYTPPPTSVSTVRPERADLGESLTVTAVLDAERTVAVVPRVPGTILEIAVEEGQMVSEGDLLARIDSEPYLLELQAAESAWLLAESSLARTERLYNSSGASLQQLEEAETGRDAALSSYRLAQIRQSYAEVRSPIDGVVLARYSDIGALASAEFPLFSVGDDGNPQVKARIPEKHWNSFHNPRPAKVLIHRPGDAESPAVEATILRISPGISPMDKTFEVTCALHPDTVEWPLGSRLSVEFILSERVNTWSLPIRALTGDGGLWWVDDMNSIARRIEGGTLYSDGTHIALPEDWAQRTYVLEGHHRLREGQLVRSYRLDS